MVNNAKYKPRFSAVLKEVVRGKSVSRTLTNLFWRGRPAISGKILDIGGGSSGSHYRFLSFAGDAKIETVDVVERKGTTYVLDITKERVPLPDSSVDIIFLFNIIEHLASPSVTITEAHRLLKRGGKIFGSIPFLVNVHRDPEDYSRFTDTALYALFESHGLDVEELEPIGRGPFLVAYEQLDMLIWSPLHLLFLPIVWALDWFITLIKPKRDFKGQFPLAYNFIIKK